MRVRALGESFRGSAFQREQTLSAAIRPAGSQPPTTGGGDGRQLWCEILHCLFGGHVLSEKLLVELKSKGIDLAAFARCQEKTCRNSNSKR